MKKIILYLCLIGVLVGCEATTDQSTADTSMEELLADTIKPLIKITNAAQAITISIGDSYIPMDGVSGLDNLEGDITHKIEYNDSEVNVNAEGTYYIYFYLADTAKNQADSVIKTIKVINPYVLTRPEVYLGDISGEAATPNTPAIFSGSWYHKVVSSSDYWCGIEGVVELPVVDINRYNGDYDESLLVDPNVKNLDNPSIYMGGNASTESDVGLSFSSVVLADGSISTGSVAFRPFWRYITYEDLADIGSVNTAANRYYSVTALSGDTMKNLWGSWRNEDTQFYYLPGDVLRMIIHIPEPNMVQFQIEVIKVSENPDSIALRAENNWEAPADFKSPYFSSPGHGTGSKAIYKRINAIDQVSNEGGTEIPTTTTVTGAVWQEVYLYRYIDNELRSIPFTEQRRAILNNPLDSAFTVSKYLLNGVDLGGMTVDLHPETV